MIASTDLLPMVEPGDYLGTIICTSHYETIAGEPVQRTQILTADARVTMSEQFLRIAGRLPYAPRLVLLRDEIDGREFYYRQTGWFYDHMRHIIAAFERLDVVDYADEKSVT